MIRPDRVLGAIKRKFSSLLFPPTSWLDSKALTFSSSSGSSFCGLKPSVWFLYPKHRNWVWWSLDMWLPRLPKPPPYWNCSHKTLGTVETYRGDLGEGSSPGSFTFDRKSRLIRIQYGSHWLCPEMGKIFIFTDIRSKFTFHKTKNASITLRIN